MLKKHISSILFFGLLFFWGSSQDLAYNDLDESSYTKALGLAYGGDHKSAQEMLAQVLDAAPENLEARALFASTLSWSGKYNRARKEFNKITSIERNNKDVWISVIKNELYAKKYATALGLSNKALAYLKHDTEIIRLKQLTFDYIKNQEYPELGWFNKNSGVRTTFAPEKKSKNKIGSKKRTGKKEEGAKVSSDVKPKKSSEKKILRNRVTIRNSFTVFDQRYEPMTYSSVSFRHKTKYGSIIPRINYSNRLGKQGLQYDLSFYPKLAKRMYAFVNYGYSNASIYPKHRVAADVYLGLPAAIEFSSGGRYFSTRTREVFAMTNSLGHYRGNYYFSLRSYITPRPDRLTKVSGSLLVRKYLRDGENYIGINFGMGFSPELRQLISGDELLAETLLYVESQRLGLAYQFSTRKTPNIYRANIGVRRQEIASDSGSFFWAISAGLTYNVKF